MSETLISQALAPDTHSIAVVLLILVALFLFTRDWLPLESSSLIVLILLVAGFQLIPYESAGVVLVLRDFFAGFGNQTLTQSVRSLWSVGRLKRWARCSRLLRSCATPGQRDPCWHW